MFTPGQVSDMLEIPPSTLRRYVKDYPEHLSETATKKRGRRYTELDIATLDREQLELARKGGAALEDISLALGHASIATTERYLGTELNLDHAAPDAVKLRLTTQD